jgi:membrane-anchored glycerophosphoryl diester phosphodiesterase (GDPDase)
MHLLTLHNFLKANVIMKKVSLAFLSALLFALPGFSHEGHGHISSKNPLHYFAEPLHAIVLVVVIAAIAYVVYRFQKEKKQS